MYVGVRLHEVWWAGTHSPDALFATCVAACFVLYLLVGGGLEAVPRRDSSRAFE